MKMHILSGGRLRMPRRIYYPDAAAEEMLDMPVSCGVFRHRQGIALFDTGCHPAAATDGEARWGGHARVSEPIFSPEDSVVGQLPKAGLTPDDVDLVICSHLHYDHCGCNAFFPGATVLCHARELEAARAEGHWKEGYITGEWDVGQAIEAVEGDRDVFGDGRLTLFEVPGHTPGSMAAHAVLDRDGSFVLASDAVPVGACLERRYAPANTVDTPLFLASLDRISRLQRDGAKVLFGHDEAQWRTLRTGGEAYE